MLFSFLKCNASEFWPYSIDTELVRGSSFLKCIVNAELEVVYGIHASYGVILQPNKGTAQLSSQKVDYYMRHESRLFEGFYNKTNIPVQQK